MALVVASWPPLEPFLQRPTSHAPLWRACRSTRTSASSSFCRRTQQRCSTTVALQAFFRTIFALNRSSKAAVVQQHCSTAATARQAPLSGALGVRSTVSVSVGPHLPRTGLYLSSLKSIHSSVCGIRNGLFSGLGWSSRGRKRNLIALISEDEISLNRIMGLIGSWIACEEPLLCCPEVRGLFIWR